jgi:hypothetical protein
MSLAEPGADPRPWNDSPAQRPGFLFSADFISRGQRLMKPRSIALQVIGDLGVSMSICGTKRSCQLIRRMSAIGGKADIAGCLFMTQSGHYAAQLGLSASA